jgi:reverse gyrase
MHSRRNRAREIAEEGFDMIVEGEDEKGRNLIEHARKIDPKAVEELAEEIERDRESVRRFVEGRIVRSVRNP